MMPENSWHPWKMTTVGLLLVGATVLVTTLVMGYRNNPQEAPMPRAATHSSGSVLKASVPSQSDVDACKAYAQPRSGAVGDTEYRTAYRSCMRQRGY